MKHKKPFLPSHLFLLIVLFTLALLVTACIAPIPLESELGAAAEMEPTPTPQAEPADKAPVPVQPAAQPQPIAPVQLSAPALGLDLPVTPMGWRVAVVDGAETTVWVVPDASLGWQVNSASPGAAGNMIFAGHQALGDALLAPLALDEFAPGQEILVTDDNGATFTYQITQISDPLPLTDATEDERAQTAAFAALDGDARLTLITGWPDFATTHRIFAVAELVGDAE